MGRLVKQIENAKVILFITCVIGALGGVLFTPIAGEFANTPWTDVYYFVPLFALLGIIVANVALLIIYSIIKDLKN